jgi:hypothetical protein
MKQTPTISETFLGVGYTRHRAELPLEACVFPSCGRPMLIRVADSSLNPLEYKLAELNFLGRTPPVVLGLDLSSSWLLPCSPAVVAGPYNDPTKARYLATVGNPSDLESQSMAHYHTDPVGNQKVAFVEVLLGIIEPRRHSTR